MAGRQIDRMRLALIVPHALIALAAAPGNAHALPVTGLDAFAPLVEAAPQGSWIHANQNTFESVWTPPELRPTITNNWPGSIINAWSSFVWDTRRSELIIYGGGHGNYTGNDVYTWSASSLQWERASLPSLGTWVGGLSYIPIDGAEHAPQSAHTYDNTVYLPLADRYMTFGGAAEGGGGNYVIQNPDGSVRSTGPYLFDPSRADPNKVGGTTGSGVNPATPGGNMWENRDSFKHMQGFLPWNFIWGTSDNAVENGKDVIYITGPQGGITDQSLYRYTINDLKDSSKDTMTVVGGAFYGRGEQGAGAFDPTRRIFVTTGDSSKDFVFWNLQNEGLFNRDIRIVIPDRPAEFHSGTVMGMDYDAKRDRFLLWGGGGDVWELKVGSITDDDFDGIISDWHLVRLGLSDLSVIPGPGVGTGTLGKWKYASNLDLFVGLTDPVAGDVWFYKPFGWVDPFQVGGSVLDPLPEPTTLILLGMGLLTLAGISLPSPMGARRRVGARP